MAKPMPPFEEMIRLPVLYTLPGMKSVVVQRDLAYKAAGEASLALDAYMPAGLGAQERRPAVIFVHGGPVPPGSQPQKMGVYLSYGELAAASGFVGITFNHRFHGSEQLLQADADVSDLVAFVRAKSGELHVDPDRIAVWAFSGGGVFLSPYLAHPAPHIRALVAYYAVLDVRTPPPGQPDTLGAETRARFSPAAVLALAAAPPPPILVARAGHDHPALNRGMDDFVREALARNLSLDLMNHPDGRHGFDILDDDARTREILRRTFAFLEERLAPR